MPGEAAYVPIAHEVHTEGEEPPALPYAVPAGHAMHVKLDVALIAVLYLPAGQFEHDADPARE